MDAGRHYADSRAGKGHVFSKGHQQKIQALTGFLNVSPQQKVLCMVLLI